MSSNLVLNPNESRRIEAPVHSISVSTGSVVVTDTHDSTVVEADGSFDAKDTANLSVYSPNSARISVTYTDEVPSEDSSEKVTGVNEAGVNTGPYEDRTAKDLRALAKDREIPNYSSLNKSELIDALRS